MGVDACAFCGPTHRDQPEEDKPTTGTKDGTGYADHDQPYRWGRTPTVHWPFPFTPRQFANLLILKSKVDELKRYAGAVRAETAAKSMPQWAPI
jgi:hypothetical protein